MNREELEQLGDQLRSVGHSRRQLVEKVFQEMKEGDTFSSREVYEELSKTSNEAIEIITRQKNMIDEEIQKLQ